MERRSPTFYNKSSLAIVASGIVGVIVSVWILLGFSLKGCDSFHEIGFHPTFMEQAFLDSIKSNILEIKELELVHKATLIRSKKYKDTTGLNKKLDSLDLLLRKIGGRQMLSMYGNKDTILDNKVRFSVKRDSLLKMLVGFQAKDTITFSYYDSTLSPIVITKRFSFELEPVSTSMRFFSRYPSFAAWTFLGILQSTLWLLAASISIILLVLTSQKPDTPTSTLPENNNFSDSKSKVKSVIVSMIVVFLFCGLLYMFIIDELVIRDVYFMNGFGYKMIPYAVIGYLVTSLCFTGYLNIADHIFYLQNCLGEGVKKMIGIKAELVKTDTATISQENQQQDNDKVRTKYLIAKKSFNIYFFMTATILSVLVLWVASLFTAVNNMDLMKYYRLISGQNFLPNDFVYLFGALHSLLLLIFFLPVKVNMFTLDALIPNSEKPEQQDQQSGTWQTLWKSLGRSIVNLLVISSPLLASIVHELATSYLGK